MARMVNCIKLGREAEGLDFLPLPRDMPTYQAPPLPEPEELAGHAGAVNALRATRAATAPP